MSTSAPLGRAVFVLGMHRSGTSCLTGCLEECGLALGSVNRSAPHNPKGNRENLEVMRLQDELLEHNGGSWDRPVERIGWTEEHRRRRDEILLEYREFSVFGIKDPRTLVTFDFWLEAELETSFVGSFRHPLAVAESLRRRNGFALARSLELWAQYNRLLIRRIEEFGFDLISFDLPEREYLAGIALVAKRLGLTPPPEEARLAFFDPALRQGTPIEEALPAEVADLFARLQRLSAVS